MCLMCGIVLCGRYHKGHALSHSTSNAKHDVCLNTSDASVYCYTCDEFVVNDTEKLALETFRQELRGEDETTSEASSVQDGESTSSKSQQETASTSSSDSGWCDDPSVGRNLRPRKRTISSDSTETKTTQKRKNLRKVRVCVHNTV